MIGTIKKDDDKSQYAPSREVREFTRLVRQDYENGWNTLHKPFEELNNKSVIERMNIDQRLWNSFVEDPSDDPDEAWRWHGIRPITRQKILTIAAHVTAQVMVPNISAQNQATKEDKDMANVMRWLMKWNIKESDYETSFLFATIGALVNPVTYMKADYFEVFQTVKRKLDNGQIKKEEILDELLSGFRASVIPPDEMLIPNAYEFDLQRQKAIMRKRFIDYDEAEAIYGEHRNFRVVRPGVRALYNEEDGMFYDQKDEQLGTLVEEVTYYNRREDVQVTFLNGVYMGDDGDPVAGNPMKHRDNRNAPKYPFAKTGYEPIDEKKFFFYKSAVNKLSHDQELVDRMWQMVMDGTFLSVMPPVAMTGEDHATSSVIFPGKVSSFNQNTKITPINVGQNLNAGYNALGEIERSMAQSSQSDIRSGVQPEGNPTAFEISRIENNANVQLGLFGKMLGKFAVDFGGLMIDDILQHQTVAEAEEILGGRVRLKFRQFLLSEEVEGGKTVSRVIRFSDRLLGMKKGDEKHISDELLNEAGGIEGDARIYEVNPYLFSKMKFRLSIDPDSMLPENEQFERAFKREFWRDAMQVPQLIDPEAITRDFLIEPMAKGETDKYMKSQKGIEPGMEKILEQVLPEGNKGNQRSNNELTKQLAGSDSNKQLLANSV